MSWSDAFLHFVILICSLKVSISISLTRSLYYFLWERKFFRPDDRTSCPSWYTFVLKAWNHFQKSYGLQKSILGHYVEIFLVRFRDKFAFIRWMEYKFHTNLYMLCSVHQWSRMHTNIILEPLRPPKRWDGGHQKFQNNGALFHMKDNPSSRWIILLLFYSTVSNRRTGWKITQFW